MHITYALLLARLGLAAGKPLLAPGFIEKHNADPASTWVAGHNHLTGLSEQEFDIFMGSVPMPDSTGAGSLAGPWPLQAAYERLKANNATFPDWFDPRDRWHWCPTTSQVRDQVRVQTLFLAEAFLCLISSPRHSSCPSGHLWLLLGTRRH